MADDQQNYGKYLAYGLEIAVGVGLGAVAGSWFDRHHASGPWGVLVGTMLGFASGMYLLIKDALAMNRDDTGHGGKK